MRKTVGLMALGLLIVGTLAVAGYSTIGVRPPAPSKETLPFKGFDKCPTPACMAPCTEPAPEQVLCKDTGGGTTATSYFCCCCGGGGNSFKWIK
jgi:hypothetical protein